MLFLQNSPQRLPASFNRPGFQFNQVCRTSKAAVYSQMLANTGQASFYEVVRIRLRKAYSFKGKAYPDTERYPCSEEWGLYGFTCNSLAGALKKLRALDPEGIILIPSTSPVTGYPAAFLAIS
jgi:hypothetical protein